jgi:hypothetical protein
VKVPHSAYFEPSQGEWHAVRWTYRNAVASTAKLIPEAEIGS